MVLNIKRWLYKPLQSFLEKRMEKHAAPFWPDGLTLWVGALKAGLTMDGCLTLFKEKSPPNLKKLVTYRLGQGCCWMSFQDQVDRIFCDRHLGLARATLQMVYQMGGEGIPQLEACAQ
jgi:hypothetical protein